MKEWHLKERLEWMSVTHRTYCTGGTLSDLILWYVTQNLTDCQVKRDYDLICNRSCHWEACMVWTQIPISAGTNIHTHLFIKHNVLLQKQSLNQTCPISPQGEKEKKKPCAGCHATAVYGNESQTQSGSTRRRRSSRTNNNSRYSVVPEQTLCHSSALVALKTSSGSV